MARKKSDTTEEAGIDPVVDSVEEVDVFAREQAEQGPEEVYEYLSTGKARVKRQGRGPVSAEQLAKFFSETYAKKASQFGYAASPAAFDPESQHGRLMTAVCAEVLRMMGNG